MTMNFPTDMPEFFRVFRVQEVNRLSHLTNVDGPRAFPVFFTHWKWRSGPKQGDRMFS